MTAFEPCVLINAVRTLHIKAKPNAKTSRLEQQLDGTWVAYLKAPPVDGAANAALIALVAAHFDVAKNKVNLLKGANTRYKKVDLSD